MKHLKEKREKKFSYTYIGVQAGVSRQTVAKIFEGRADECPNALPKVLNVVKDMVRELESYLVAA